MKLNAFSLTILLLFINYIKHSYCETSRQASKKITITKCCRVGDKLRNDRKCEPGGGRPNWAPKVYLPKKKSVYEKMGYLPPFFHLEEKDEFVPSCHSPEVFKSSDLYIIANGSLFLQNKHKTINDQFCVDQEYSVVCFPEQDSVPDNMTIIKLTKCCGPNEIYQSNSCATLNSTNPLYKRKLLDDGSLGIDFEYKFPDCGGSNEFAIIGPFLFTITVHKLEPFKRAQVNLI
jgi:hypothetical protein